VKGKPVLACQATLKYENNNLHRLITSIHLSRFENYLSIYQFGLKNIRLGNLGVFICTEADRRYLLDNVVPGVF
jgi:hypothetical protein